MILAMIVCVVLVIATIAVHYEVLRLTSVHLRDLPVPPRLRIVAVVVAAFTAHTIEVWIYGIAYWLLAEHFGLGALTVFGAPGDQVARIGFEDFIYFSAVTYTSLGFGDLSPTHHIRLIAGVEALNGLVLIGWSASFTYLVMEKYWPLHDDVRRRPPRP